MANDEGATPIPKRRLKLTIPKEIKREHIIQALEELKNKPSPKWPPKNNSTTYDLFYEGERFPPKIVVMYANKYTNGELFDVSKFSGGEDTTNKFFRSRGFVILDKNEKAPQQYIDPTSTKGITEEREKRLKIWNDLRSQNATFNIPPDLLRERNIYGGAAGIWRDKNKTASLSQDAYGITISVLLTGEYPDDMDEQSLIYHCPDTDRPGNTDKNDIIATKNAMKFQLPVFIITHSESNEKKRDLRLGYVKAWNEDNQTFLIKFSQAGEKPEYSISDGAESPFQLTQKSDRRTRKNSQLERDPEFRFNVISRYGLKCAVCSIDIDNLLSAAHIKPKKFHGTDNERNGLVLCHNHHRAFDDYLFSIDPKTHKLVFPINGRSKTELKIETDSLTTKRNLPHELALEWRHNKFLEMTAEPLGKPTRLGRSPDERQTSLITPQ